MGVQGSQDKNTMPKLKPEFLTWAYSIPKSSFVSIYTQPKIEVNELQPINDWKPISIPISMLDLPE